VRRFAEDLPLTPYDRSTFYSTNCSLQGYTDWLTYEEQQEQQLRQQPAEQHQQQQCDDNEVQDRADQQL
jgi:hypothetical protein